MPAKPISNNITKTTREIKHNVKAPSRQLQSKRSATLQQTQQLTALLQNTDAEQLEATN
jgi:hypothetical protein